MKNTVCNTILSIVDTKDPKFIQNKIESLEAQVTLNEVEQQIIKDIKDNLFMSNVISREFIEEKYPYYTENDENIFPVVLSRESIDSAIIDIRLRQLKANLSKDMLELGSQITTLSPADIKLKFSEMYGNVLIEQRQEAPQNALKQEEDPYGQLTQDKEGLSLVLPRVEEHAGKARKGSIISILAFTGGFKSTYAINVAYKNALDGHNMLYLSLESPTIEIASRFVLRHIAETVETRDQLLDAKWVRDNKLTKEQQKFYNKKHNEMVKTLDNHLILWGNQDFEYRTFTDMTETLRIAEKEFIEKTGKGVDGIIVDQLALLKYTLGSGKKYGYDGAILNDWVSYFREQSLNFLDEEKEVTTFIVSQTSRNAHAEASKPKKKGRYDASCTSDSHELERSSSTMITLFKDWETKDTILVNIPKARHGYSPDNPLQEEAYGSYFHIGAMKFSNESITADDFNDQNIDLADLIG